MNVVSIIDDRLFDVVDADVGDFVVDTVFGVVVTDLYVGFVELSSCRMISLPVLWQIKFCNRFKNCVKKLHCFFKP